MTSQNNSTPDSNKKKEDKRLKTNSYHLRFNDVNNALIKENFEIYRLKGGTQSFITPYLEEILINNKTVIKESRFTPTDLEAIARLGNNLNQITKRLHQLHQVDLIPDRQLWEKFELIRFQVAQYLENEILNVDHSK